MNGSMVSAPVTQLHLHGVVYGDKKACEHEARGLENSMLLQAYVEGFDMKQQ